ncbi:ABC transporter G family member 11 [Dichanthelium oligosanthes]|uniref:ABC transporter G family member 11 n=1 Tax=Dichanthelium oligosanthes TaxID=888268 RepID=A0A1E5VVY7_9POAL|nr:ABC transporter G family member 11 [Dichanthelium oligosanthes]
MAAPSALPRCTPTPSPTRPLNGVGGTGEHQTSRGVFLTWQDVSVTAVDQKGRHAVILDRITGCARPGQVLALMGPSGSGKTTLLDTLSGRLGADMNGTGDILINGRRERISYGTSAYVTQENTLMTTLTVREAIQYSAQLQLPGSMPPAEKLARADRTIRDMGLGAVASSRIGGRVCKGISGGERKRVSICMELLASPSLLFLDEPTSGLDSAAAYHVMSHIARLARTTGITVIAAVHQPSTEVFDLFNGLCLLANGRMVYFGPIPEAAEVLSLIKERQAGFFTKLIVLTKRSSVNMHRDIGYYWLRFAIFFVICLCIGSIFYNIGDTSFGSIQARTSLIMFITTILTMTSLGGFPSFAEDMKVFRKERLNGRYGATAFVISNTLSSAPFLGLNCIIPGAIVYYMTGLQRGIDHFIYFVAVLWACTLLVEGLMMIVAAIVPDFLLGVVIGSGIQGLLLLNCGFFRLPDDLPKPVWKYPMYFISYHKYGIQGLYKNEFHGLAFEDQQNRSGYLTGGDHILKNNLQVEMGYSKWVDLAILCAMVIIYRATFLAMIKLTEMNGPIIKCGRMKV